MSASVVTLERRATDMRGAASTARLASYVTRLTLARGVGSATNAARGAGRAVAGPSAMGAPYKVYVPPHRRGVTGGRSSPFPRASSASSSAAFKMDGDDGKILHLVRHGRTEMNEYLASNRWDASDFVDPLLYDTRLTKKGAAQAASLAPVTRFLDPKPEVLIASPLHRAMTTADLAFAGCEGIRKETCALMRERVFHASDVGRHPDAIEADFPDWCVKALREEHADANGVWWYAGEVGGDRMGTASSAGGVVAQEPVDLFERRMGELVRWIESRPERSIAMVAHWGVWYSLTGREFENCELVTCELGDLRVGAGKFVWG